MEPNVAEALKAKAYAEKHFAEGDFTGARNYALKAQMICPQLVDVSQMVATFGVYTASEVRINGELDLYGILGLEPSADKSRVKKQYKKMAVLLHPDKNKSVGADGAFKYVSDAWTVLSNHVKRSMYDQRRNITSLHAPGSGSYINYSNPQVASNHRLDTFWTVCTSCHVQYEYLRKYVNKRLSCKNCRSVFIAAETGAAPANGSYQFSQWSYIQEKSYGGHSRGATYMPNHTSVYQTTNDVSGYHPGHGSEYPSNVTIEFDSFPGTPAGSMDANGFSTSTYLNHQPNGKANRATSNGKSSVKKTAVNVVSNGHGGCGENPVSNPGWSAKKRKVDEGSRNEVPTRNSTEARATNANGNLKPNSKLYSSTETSVRRHSTVLAFDVRQLLIDKARSDISKKVEEMRLASVAEKKRKALAEVVMSRETLMTSDSNSTSQQSELKRTVSMSITVPDSDFHDFDKDRSEECFKPKQIWALYDEEDGMPRLYCLIRQVISVNPFKIFISYLSSKTDSEFGIVNWLCSGFSKSCGSFRVFNSETVEQVNIFIFSKEKGW
ncbi:hypothetical protein Leryth_021460 [Lithospermum erythrorhizon]|nr:hypothetical protein Leryth_021460 [Lithospermum erythrorhizon]